MLKYKKIFFSNKIYGSNFVKTALGNLWFEITKMLIAVKKQIYCNYIIFSTLSFPSGDVAIRYVGLLLVYR